MVDGLQGKGEQILVLALLLQIPGADQTRAFTALLDLLHPGSPWSLKHISEMQASQINAKLYQLCSYITFAFVSKRGLLFSIFVPYCLNAPFLYLSYFNVLNIMTESTFVILTAGISRAISLQCLLIRLYQDISSKPISAYKI